MKKQVVDENIVDGLMGLLLEDLENSCFPIQVDWNNKELYIKGLKQAFKMSGLKFVKTESEIK